MEHDVNKMRHAHVLESLKEGTGSETLVIKGNECERRKV